MQPHQLFDAAETRAGACGEDGGVQPEVLVFHGPASLPAALQEDTVRRLETSIFPRVAADWPGAVERTAGWRLCARKSERQDRASLESS